MKEETSENYSNKTLLAISKMEEGQKCVEEAKQMFLAQIKFLNTSLKGVVSHKEELLKKNKELGDRYNNVCAEANMLQAEVKKLKANNNNDLCIQLREEIACLKRDNGVLKESNNTFVETIRDQEKQIRDLENENNILREGKKVVEAKNDDLTEANKCLEEAVQNLNKILKEIKNLVS